MATSRSCCPRATPAVPQWGAPPFEDIPPTPQLKRLIPDFKPAFTSDNFLVQWRACEAGLGAMILGGLRHRFSLPSTLVPLDVDLGPHRESTLHLVCAKSALALPRVRAVAELALEELTRPAARKRRAPPG
jgi:DNA-binding transcriptional LysR family regulator